MRMLRPLRVCIALHSGRNGTEDPTETKKAQEESRVKGNLATNLLLILSAKATPGLSDAHRSITSSADAILAMVSYTAETDPWNTEDTFSAADMYLHVTCQYGVWPIVERVLKEKIRPLFAKTKNPAITSEGRKNLHPVPPTRFDGSALDDTTKPWKNTDIYATTVLSWIISQYQVFSDEARTDATNPLTSALASRQDAPGSTLPSARTGYPIFDRRQQHRFQNKGL